MSTDWQDISSAPRDGSPVELTWFDNGQPAEVWTMQWDPAAKNGLFPGKAGFWVTPDRSMTWNEDGDGGPTHWRPSTAPAAAPHPCAETMGSCAVCYGEGVCGLPPIPEAEADQLAPVSRFPTPYGVEVDVYTVNVEGKMVDITPPEGTAVLFGIYDQEARQRFVDDLAAGMPDGNIADAVKRHGGHRVPRVPLDLPAKLAANALSPTLRAQVAALAEILNERPRWADRAEVMLMQPTPLAPIWNSNPEMVGGCMAVVIAAVLEGLAEEEVACLEAAAFYALSSHAAWREAGRQWLFPFRSTWLRDWTAARPPYCRLARAVRKAHPDVPAWLCGVS